MTIALVVNGVTFPYPEQGDEDWGPTATDWAAAVTSGMLQKAGGTFTLTAEVDFGASYGLKSLYYKSRTANPADAGQFRLARADVISWRNQANSANLDLAVNSSNELTFNGVVIGNFVSVSDTNSIDLTLSSGTLSADLKLSSASATAGSFKATASIESDGLLVQAPIATTSLTGFISSSDWNTFNNKQAALTIGNITDVGTDGITITGGTGAIIGSGVSLSQHVADSTHNGYLSSVDWSTFNGKQDAGNYITALTGDVTASGPGSASATIAANAVTNSKLAQVATATFKGRTTAGTGNVEDLTATQATALLNNMVGDSGSGGTKGLAPAPAAGDAAASKFLKADGTWSVPSGAGDVTGPGSSTANAVALFNGTTGKVIKDGGTGTSSQVLVGGTTPGFGAVPSAALPVATISAYGALKTYVPDEGASVKILSGAGYTILSNDGYRTIEVTTGASDRTIITPAVASSAGRILIFKKADNGAGGLIVSLADGTLGGATSTKLVSQYAYLVIYCDGSNWFSLGAWDIITPAVAQASAVSLTTNTAKTVASATIQTGTWICGGTLGITGTTTVIDILSAGLSTSDNTLPSADSGLFAQTCLSSAIIDPNVVDILFPLPSNNTITLTAATTYYLVARARFGSGTASGYGQGNFVRIK